MSHLSDAAKKAQAEYMREWRRKNKESVRESNRKYWERKAAQQKEREEHAETKDKP